MLLIVRFYEADVKAYQMFNMVYVMQHTDYCRLYASHVKGCKLIGILLECKPCYMNWIVGYPEALFVYFLFRLLYQVLKILSFGKFFILTGNETENDSYFLTL